MEQYITIANGMKITEPVITKIHRKCYRASFKMLLINGVAADIEIDSPTHERCEEKIKHLKETGIILRN